MSSSQPPRAAPTKVNLGWSLATLLRAYHKQVDAALATLPGGARGFLVISLVQRETCHSQIGIADRLGLDKTTMTYLLDGLEKDGLIARSTDPNDRRSRHINLTAKGSRALAAFTVAVDRVEQDVLSRLTESEAETLKAILEKAAGLTGPATGDSTDDHAICRAALSAPDAC